MRRDSASSRKGAPGASAMASAHAAAPHLDGEQAPPGFAPRDTHRELRTKYGDCVSRRVHDERAALDVCDVEIDRALLEHDLDTRARRLAHRHAARLRDDEAASFRQQVRL